MIMMLCQIGAKVIGTGMGAHNVLFCLLNVEGSHKAFQTHFCWKGDNFVQDFIHWEQIHSEAECSKASVYCYSSPKYSTDQSKKQKQQKQINTLTLNSVFDKHVPVPWICVFSFFFFTHKIHTVLIYFFWRTHTVFYNIFICTFSVVFT